jgi:hypothetical protein
MDIAKEEDIPLELGLSACTYGREKRYDMWSVEVIKSLIEHCQSKGRYVPLILGLTLWVSAKLPNKWKAACRRQTVWHD